MEIMLASKNPGKILQFKTLLNELNIDLEFYDIAVIEDGKSEKENAIKKARTYKNKFDKIILADDAGIYFDALDNKPGIEARRWMGHFKDDVSDEEWLTFVLSELTKYESRTGYFKACWCIYSDKIYTKEIKLDFEYTLTPSQNYTKGFPLSSILIDKNTKQPLFKRDIKSRCDEIRNDFFDFLKEANIIK